MNKTQELISQTFRLRNEAHVAHWKADSGFHHEVLGEFYTGLIGLLDRFVEANLGATMSTTGIEGGKDVSELIKKQALWVTENRSALSHGLPALEAILDDVVELHLSTHYKLERMK